MKLKLTDKETGKVYMVEERCAEEKKAAFKWRGDGCDVVGCNDGGNKGDWYAYVMSDESATGCFLPEGIRMKRVAFTVGPEEALLLGKALVAYAESRGF